MVCDFLVIISNTVEVIFVLLHTWHEYAKLWSQLSLYPWLCDIKRVTIRLTIPHNEDTLEQKIFLHDEAIKKYIYIYLLFIEFIFLWFCHEM